MSLPATAHHLLLDPPFFYGACGIAAYLLRDEFRLTIGHCVVTATDPACSSVSKAPASVFCELVRVARFVGNGLRLLFPGARGSTLVFDDGLSRCPATRAFPISAHVLPRFQHDFVPNNLVYYHLSRLAVSANPVSISAKTPRLVANLPVEMIESAQNHHNQLKSLLVSDDVGLDLLLPGRSHPCSNLSCQQGHPFSQQVSPITSSATAPLAFPPGSTNNCQCFTTNCDDQNPKWHFGPYLSDRRTIVFTHGSMLVSVNLKPLLPGHLLIVPRRPVASIYDLSNAELMDMAVTCQRCVGLLTNYRRYRTQGSSPASDGECPTDPLGFQICVQEGVVAGQTVPHVHMHVIPAMETDALDQMQAYPADDEVEHMVRKPRTVEEMAAEAKLLAQFVPRQGPC